MKVLKFGGASVKDALGVQNLTKVLEVTGTQKTLIVVSAMGKTTNSLEKVVNNYFNAKHKLQSSIQEIKKYHNEILLDLFNNDNELIFKEIRVGIYSSEAILELLCLFSIKRLFSINSAFSELSLIFIAFCQTLDLINPLGFKFKLLRISS